MNLFNIALVTSNFKTNNFWEMGRSAESVAKNKAAAKEKRTANAAWKLKQKNKKKELENSTNKRGYWFNIIVYCSFYNIIQIL